MHKPVSCWQEALQPQRFYAHALQLGHNAGPNRPISAPPSPPVAAWGKARRWGWGAGTGRENWALGAALVEWPRVSSLSLFGGRLIFFTTLGQFVAAQAFEITGQTNNR